MTALHPISHHPGEDLIAAYAAGALDEASALVIATHMTLCTFCRKQAAAYEALGASLMEALPEAAMADGALAATLARAKAPAPQSSNIRPMTKNTHAPAFAAILPAPLRRYVGGDVEAAKWRALGLGIHHMPLVHSDGVTARLLRLAPGRSIFDHSHGGSELTLVLKGSYRAQGERFVRGDIEVADAGVSHRPVAGTEDICICLAVTDAPLRFHNWIGRLMQPFIGI